MGLNHSPRIVTDGLIFAVDAANLKSYPGSGSTWFDLSGNGNHLTLTGSPVFTSGVAQFNGTTQYADNNLNLTTGTSTYMGAARYSGTIKGRVLTSKTNNYVLGHYSNQTENLFAEGWVYGPGAGTNDTNWRIFAATHNVTADIYSLYVDGVLRETNGGGAAGPNGIAIARSGVYTGEISQCEVSFVLAYNRVLSATEIQQNFNTLRRRFGI